MKVARLLSIAIFGLFFSCAASDLTHEKFTSKKTATVKKPSQPKTASAKHTVPTKVPAKPVAPTHGAVSEKAAPKITPKKPVATSSEPRRTAQPKEYVDTIKKMPSKTEPVVEKTEKEEPALVKPRERGTFWVDFEEEETASPDSKVEENEPAKLSKDEIVQRALDGLTMKDLGVETSELPEIFSLLVMFLSIPDPEIKELSSEKGIAQTLLITGKATVDIFSDKILNVRIFVRIPVEGAMQVSAFITLPETFKLSDLTKDKDFKDLDFLKLKNPTLVLTTVDFVDPETNLAFRAGATIIGRTTISSKESALGDAAEFVGKGFDNVWVQGRLKGTVKETRFVVTVPSTSAYDLGSKLVVGLDLPESLATSLRNLKIKSPVIMLELGVDVRRVVIDGAVTLPNTTKEIQATLLAENKKGILLRLQLSEDWKFATTFAEIAKTIELPYQKPELIITSFAFKDTQLGIELQPGANLLAFTRMQDLPSTPFFTRIKATIGKLTDGMLLHAVFKKNLKQSVVYATVRPSKDKEAQTIPLKDIIGDTSGITISEPFKSMIGTVALVQPEISLTLSKAKKELVVDGALMLSGNRVAVQGLILQEEKKEEEGETKEKKAQESEKSESSQVIARLVFILPDTWKPSETFGAGLNVSGLKLNSPRIIISANDYKDEELDVDIKRGVNIVANTSFNEVLKAANLSEGDVTTQKLAETVTASGDKFIFHAVVGVPLSTSLLRIELVSATPGVNKIDMSALFGDTLHIPLSASLKNTLSQIVLLDPFIDLTLSKETKALVLKGQVYFGSTRVDAKLLVKKTSGENTVASLRLLLPPEWQLSQAFAEGGTTKQEEEKVDERIKLEQPALIFSSAAYDDDEYDIKVGAGVTIVSAIDLEKALGKDIKNAFEGLKKLKPPYVVKWDGGVVFKAVLAPTMMKSSLEFVVPLRIGVDYTQVPVNKRPQGIDKIMTDGFSCVFSPVDFKFAMATGLHLYLTNQNPLDLNATIRIDKGIEFRIVGEMQGTLKNVFGLDWLELGNFRFGLGFNIETGLPIAIDIGGKMLLGQGADTAAVEIQTSIDLVQPQDTVFIGDASNLDLANFVALFGKMIGEKIPKDGIPPLTFRKAQLHVVPGESARILGKTYKQGLYAFLDADIFGLQYLMELKVDTKGIIGSASLGKLVVPHDTPVLILSRSTGANPGDTQACCAGAEGANAQPKDGPTLCINITKDKQAVCLDGRLQIVIPPTNKSLADQDSFLQLLSTGFDASLKSTFGPFNGSVEVSANFAKLASVEDIKNLGFRFTFDANEFFDSINMVLGKDYAQLAALARQIQELREQCKAAPNKAEVCPDLGLEIYKKVAARKAMIQKLGGNFGLAFYDATNWYLENVFGGFVRLKAVDAKWCLGDIIAGKLMSLSLCLDIVGKESYLSDFQLDFTDLGGSLKKIVDQLINMTACTFGSEKACSKCPRAGDKKKKLMCD